MSTHSLYLPLLFDEHYPPFVQLRDYLPDATVKSVLIQLFYWWPAMDRGEWIEDRLLRHLDPYTRGGANLSAEHSLTAAFYTCQLMHALFELYAPYINPTLKPLLIDRPTYQIECHVDAIGDPRVIIHI